MKIPKNNRNAANSKLNRNKRITDEERDLLAGLADGFILLFDAVDSTIRGFENDGTFPYEPEDKPCMAKLADLKRWVGQSTIACRRKLQLRDAIEFAEQARDKAEEVITKVKPAPELSPHIVEIVDAASDLAFAAGWLYNAMRWYDGRIIKEDLSASIRTAVSKINGPTQGSNS